MSQLLEKWRERVASAAPAVRSPAPARAEELAEAPAAAKPLPEPRRVVLLADGPASEVERVLAEFHGEAAAGVELAAEVRRFAAEHPGRHVGAEWRGRLGWNRFLCCRR